MVTRITAQSALLADGWAQDVSLDIDADGNIQSINKGVADARPVCLLPGMANLHSHAHQRAMAGLAERAGDSNDSFWTWRTTMYGFLDAIQPDDLHIIAAQLYIEMLKAGYTRVAEFQYLHHQADGSHYNNIAEMSLQTMRAATDVGLGITNLPVHYQFGGFGAQPVADQQRRFANDPEHIAQIVDRLRLAAGDNQNIVTGIAAHSLRAVTQETFAEVLASFSEFSVLPVHIHIAEQTKEVDDCVAWSSLRPVDYLFNHFDVDEQWCLIHATHMTDHETDCLASSGAVAGLCPTTEGNLGDGFFNATRYLKKGGRMGIGSDSHISVSPVEELRWFEYGQRLMHRSRNQLSGGFNQSTGRNLFAQSVVGGAQACGHNSGVLAEGKRADFILLDATHPILCERHEDELIDSWVFSGNRNVVSDVYVGGQRVVADGYHKDEDRVAAEFRNVLARLRG